MSRLNALLRDHIASNESYQSAQSIGPSLEDYMEYRAALEDQIVAAAVSDKLDDLSESLTEVEGLVIESREKDELTEDQVQLQMDMVNSVREVLGGDTATVSMESFASIESASLHASVESKGLLSRMWEGFLAMLRAIRDAFKKAWNWIFGGTKRAEEAAKVVKEAAKEVKEEAKEKAKSTDTTKPAPKTEAEKTITKSAAESEVTLEEITKTTKKVVPEAKKDVMVLSKLSVDIAQAMTATAQSGQVPAGFVIPTQEIEAVDKKADATAAEVTASLADTKTSLTQDIESIDLAATLERLGNVLTGYSKEHASAASLLKDIDDVLGKVEQLASRVRLDRVENTHDAAHHNFLMDSEKALKKGIRALNKHRTTVMALLQKGDNAVTKSDAVARKLSKKERKEQRARELRARAPQR